jgi:hypothetical protein
MMDENNLRIYVDDFFGMVELYDDYENNHNYKDLLKAAIDAFLDNENEGNAYEVYEIFFMIYQITSENKSDIDENTISAIDEPNTLLDLVKIMRKYEVNTGDLVEKQRDHFIHSVNVFILGLAIYSQNKHYRDAFRQYVKKSPYKKYYRLNGEFSHEEFLYRWGIAALFHDIGYPVEIIGKQMKKFVNDGIKSISNSYEVETAIDFKDFNEFNSIRRLNPTFGDNYWNVYPEAKFIDLFKPTDIMAFKIAMDFPELNIAQVQKHLNRFVSIMGDGGFIDHGFFSSIIVLNSYGYLIQKYSKNQDFFFYPIVDSATAILLHNYYGNVLRKEPFKLGTMHPTRNPLAFLLILCDELQEWNRQPLGVKNKQKSSVNELQIKINDDLIGVEYIVKSGALGLGFSQNKEDFLNSVLSLRGIFRWGLSVLTHVKFENVIREMEKKEVHTPSIILRNVEKLAIKIHEDYVLKEKADGNKDVIENFNDLTPELKMSNIRQAKSIATKLTLIGCEMAPINDEREKYVLSRDETLDLAIYEHEEWCNEKLANGWVYGPRRNNTKKIHPDLVPWVDERYVSKREAKKIKPQLSEKEKLKDINAIDNIPMLLESIGMKVVMSKLRLLTIEKHNFYGENEKVESFDDLPYYVKFSNFRQTDVLIRALGELGFNIVSVDDPSEAITMFNEDQIEYLAKRDHAEWYNNKMNLGWVWGPEKTDKTNPNLVEWDALSDDVKILNLKTFEYLPKLCDNVGLKIVKN